MTLRVRKSRAAPDPGCPVGRCMTLIGGVWTPSLIWALSGGPRRFGELRIDLKGISAKVLSTRLRDLEARKLICREVRDGDPPSFEYALTVHGRDLMPAIQAIAEVGTRLKLLSEVVPD
jgi:DNA-binding HxlR family transcriptional regulator